MKLLALAALIVPAAEIAQAPATAVQPKVELPATARPMVAPPVDLRSPLQVAPLPCLVSGPKVGSGIIGEKIIGEKVIGEKSAGGDAVIGEKVIGEKIIGEKVIGEKSAPSGGKQC